MSFPPGLVHHDPQINVLLEELGWRHRLGGTQRNGATEEKQLVDSDPLLTGNHKTQDPALWLTMVLSGGDQREHTRGHPLLD